MPSARFGGFAFGWEVGLLVVMVLLYVVGSSINPRFFGDLTALQSVLRDASRYGVMAVGMTFVIVNRDLDLSVGSTLGLVAVVFSIAFAPTHFDLPAWAAVLACLVTGLAIGLINGVLVTWLKVPAFIATLTMLFVGRGMVLGLTGGKTIAFEIKAREFAFFALGEGNALGFNNQILVFVLVAVVGGIVLARTRWGYETYAVGGNALAAEYAGIETRVVRIRGFVLASLCATLAGLMNVAQDKGVTSQYGLGAELIVIAAVIVGGASILGGRGRVLGSCLGAILVVLIDKVLREGVPITRTLKVGNQEMQVQAMASLPPGAVPAFLGLILLAAVLIEPWIIRRKLIPRLLARFRGTEPPPIDVGTVAIEAPRTHGTNLAATEFSTRGLRWWLTQREAAAVIFMVALWLFGFWLRPDFWGGLDNSFNLLLAFTEIGLMAVGMSYVMANGDVDLSVGAVLALSGLDRGLPDEVHGLGAPARRSRRLRRRPARRLRQRPALHPAPAARLRRDARHVLRRPRHRRLAGGRAAAQPVPRELQPDRPQADRDPARPGHRPGAGQPVVRRRQRPVDAEHPPGAAGDRRRDRPGQDPHRLHGVRNRRQPARRRVCRHRHRQGAVLEPRLQLRLRLARRPDLHRLFTARSIRPPGSCASST